MTVLEFIRWLERVGYAGHDKIIFIAETGARLIISDIVQTSDSILIFTHQPIY